MWVLTVFLVLVFLGGCTPQRVSTEPVVVPPISVTEQTMRPERVAYALKSISLILPDSQMTKDLSEGIRTPPSNYFNQFPADKRGRAAELWSQAFVPEILGRLTEVKELLAGVFADILTTDELRRLAEVADHPGAVRFQNKQPLTDQDVQDFGRLGLIELSKRLEETKPIGKELLRERAKEWAMAVVGDLMRRKPELFVDATK